MIRLGNHYFLSLLIFWNTNMILVRTFLPPAAAIFKSTSRRRRLPMIGNTFGSVATTTTSSSPLRLFLSTSSATHNNNNNDNLIITYITDVEGDKAYLDRYVEMSKVLQFTPSNDSDADANDASFFRYDRRIDFSNDHTMLVYGGDVWDKGGYDLYVIRQLIDLKRRYPDRVVFILGNRDINKLRILQEIGVFGKETIPHHPGVLWLKGTGRVGDPDSNPPPEDAAERLKWMLGNTMGSPDAFEHRRNELAWERRGYRDEIDDDTTTTTTVSISDAEVVESYQRSCHPNGELGEYLSQACLAKKLGPLLFVHGSLPLTKATMQQARESGQTSVWDDFTVFMPWLPPGTTAPDIGVVTADDWLDALNEFCTTKIKAWKQDIERIESSPDDDDHDSSSSNCIWTTQGGYHYGPAYSGLIQYGMGMMPGGNPFIVNPSVVYSSFTPSGMPERFIPGSEEEEYMHCTKEFFDRANLNLILVGHKPQGDLPSPIRVDSSSWVLCCDTSYSGDTIWHHHHDDSDDDNNKIRNETEEDDSIISGAVVERRGSLGRGSSVSFRGEVAVSEVLLELKSEPLASASSSSDNNDLLQLQSVKYHGVLSDGTEYGTVNLLDHAHNSSIGQVAPDHLVPSELDSPHQGRWWTKSIFADGAHLFHAGEGFNIWNFVSKPKSST